MGTRSGSVRICAGYMGTNQGRVGLAERSDGKGDVKEDGDSRWECGDSHRVDGD